MMSRLILRTFGMGTCLPESNLEETCANQDTDLHTAPQGSDFFPWQTWGVARSGDYYEGLISRTIKQEPEASEWLP